MRIDSDSMRRALEMALEVGTGLTLVTVTLLYTPVFSDMFEAKGLVASGLCLWLTDSVVKAMLRVAQGLSDPVHIETRNRCSHKPNRSVAVTVSYPQGS